VEFVKDEDKYIVKLDVWEGPLDLLLHCIRENDIDIFDIPIALVTTKYLEYLELMEQFNLDLASEYLEMAAHLAWIKSKMLVPSDLVEEEDDDFELGPDPREELVRRLLEYQKYKKAAGELADRPQLGRDTFPRGGDEKVSVDRDLASPGLFSLMEAFQQILTRSDQELVHEISITRMSISDRINQLVDILKTKHRMAFSELFKGQRSRIELVITFLSLLEMSKLGLVLIHQASIHGDIHISKGSGLEDLDTGENPITVEE
jgi:segregation and condensation protein A